MMTDKFTDAEYIREMKRQGFTPSCKEQIEHNERLERIANRLESLPPTKDVQELARELIEHLIHVDCMGSLSPEGDIASYDIVEAALTAAEQRGYERSKADSAKIAEGQCHLAKDGLSIAHRIRNMEDAAPSLANSGPVKS